MSDTPATKDDLQCEREPESEDGIATEQSRQLAQELAEQLSDAVRTGDSEAARSLLRRGARRDEEDADGKLPIHVAASRRDGEMVKLLVANGASVDELDADGKTQLYCEAERGSDETVAFLLSHGAEVDARSMEAKTALFAATERGFDRIAQRLMEAGADVNAADLQQRTPLCVAAKNGHLACIRLLVDRNAAVDTAQERGRSPLLLAASNGHVKVVEYLLERNPAVMRNTDKKKWTALHVAVSNNRVEVAALLIEKDAPIDAKREPDGTAPLHVAAQRGFMSAAKLLIQSQASLDIKQHQGKTPLHLAVENDNIDVTEELVGAGASVDEQDANGSSPLFMAVSRNHTRIVNLLLRHGASAYKKDAQGRTALMAAAKHGRLEIAKKLVEKGAEVNATDRFGRSALMIALSNHHRMVTRWLLKEHAASVETKDHAGWTPLHVAAASRDHDMVRLLVQRGAKGDTKNRDGKTALDFAVEKGFRDVVDVLASEASGAGKPLDYTRLLMTAARFGRLSLLIAIRSQNAMALHREASGDVETVLLSLARWGRVGVFKRLFEDSIKHASNRSDGSAVLLRDTLKSIHKLCADVEESQQMFENVVTRLTAIVVNGMKALREKDETKTTLAYIVYRFCRQLLQYRRHSTVTRFMMRRSANMALRDFHSEIDDLLQRLDLRDVDKSHENWRSSWQLNEETQTNMYRTALLRGEFLRELPSKVDRVEAAMHLLYMLKRSEPTEGVIAKSAIQQLVNSGGETSVQLSDVPPWFLSRYEVEFERWSHVAVSELVKTKRMDSSVTILKSDLELAQFLQIATTWNQLKHPNIIDLFGACPVGQPRFFVFDSLRDECLKSYLRSQRDQAAVFTKLHEVAQGLLFLHERGIVHGNLTSDRLLVGVDGKTKIGGFEQGVFGDVSTQCHSYSPANTDWTPPEVQRGEVPTVKSDIFSFGVCILDMLTMRDSWRVCSGDSLRRYLLRSSSLPPPGIPNREHWILIKGMCALNPTRRVKLKYILNTLEYFIEKALVDARCKRTSNSVGSPNDKLTAVEGLYTADLTIWREPGQSHSLPDKLIILKERCATFPEAQELAEFIHLRLQDVFARLVAKKLSPASWAVTKFIEVLSGFESYLAPGGSSLSHTKRARSQRIAFSHEGFHKKIDELLDLLSVVDRGKIHEWEDKHQELVKKLGSICCEESDSGATKSQIVTVRSIKSLKRDQSDQSPPVSVHSKLSRTKDWFIDLSRIEFDKSGMIAEGSFSKVYRGMWNGMTPVVVKFITADEYENTNELFLHEVKIWYPLKHAHVVTLWGACDIGKRYFVCDEASNGTLSGYLKANAKTMSAEKLRELAWKLLYQATLGLQYCHSNNVIHNDLKCDNILIGADKKAKLSDFGLSSMPGVAELTFEKTGRMGALQWKAPEYIYGGKPSFASDIFSLAMCIVEAMRIVGADTRSDPTPWGKSMSDFVVKNYVKRGQRPMQPASMGSAEWDLVVHMTVTEPADRPSIGSVVGRLRVIAEETEDGDITEL